MVLDGNVQSGEKTPDPRHEDCTALDESMDDIFDEEDPSEDGDDRFFNPALLSHIAVRLKDKVPRGTHVKGSIPYPRAFTGKDIVVSIDPDLSLSVTAQFLCSPPSNLKSNASC